MSSSCDAVRGSCSIFAAPPKKPSNPGDANAELTRDDGMTELVQHHRGEHEQQQRDAADPAEPDQRDAEQEQEARFDGDKVNGSEPEGLEHAPNVRRVTSSAPP